MNVIPVIAQQHAASGFADVALGSDPGRIEVFLDRHEDHLEALVEGWSMNTLWRMTVDERPDLMARVLVAMTNTASTRCAGRLGELVNNEASWRDGTAIACILARAAQIDDETLDEVLYTLAPQTLYRCLVTDETTPRGVLRELLDTHGLAQWSQGASGSSWEGMNLIQLLVEHLHTMDIAGADKHQMLNGQDTLDVLVAGGCDLEKDVVMDGGGYAASCASALHMACFLEDQEPTTHAYAIDLLINAGADVDRVLSHRNAPQGAGREAVMRHPKMRARALGQLVDETPSPRLRTPQGRM